MAQVKCTNCGALHYKKPSKLKKLLRPFCSRMCNDEFFRRTGISRKPRRGITAKCGVCGNSFYAMQSRYRLAKRVYCSVACKNTAQLQPKDTLKCEQCGNNYLVYPSVTYWNKQRNHKHNFCSKGCASNFYSGEQNANWSGGKYTNDHGYVLVHRPDHPRPVAGSYVYEHRIVVEESLGRYLTADEDVHHINGVKNDNRLENLQLMYSSEHAKHHFKEKDFDANHKIKSDLHGDVQSVVEIATPS